MGNNWTEVAMGEGKVGVNISEWKSSERVRLVRIQSKKKGESPGQMKTWFLFRE